MFAVHVRHVNLINDCVAVDVAIALVPHVHRKHLAPTYRPPQFRWVSEQNAQRQLSRPFFHEHRVLNRELFAADAVGRQVWRAPTIPQTEGIPEGALLEGKPVLSDWQGREPAGSAFLLGGCHLHYITLIPNKSLYLGCIILLYYTI